jgi:ATP-dependent Clp protease ATP-binding subunit ClpA
MDSWTGFDEEARDALAGAQDEAGRLNQRSIDSGHLLLGLMRGPSGHGRAENASTARARLNPVRGAEAAMMLRDAGVGEATTNAAQRLLTQLGLDLSTLRDQMAVAAGPPIVGEVSMAQDAKRAIELAVASAKTRGSTRVGSMDLLVGVLNAGGPGATLLRAAGVTPRSLLQETSSGGPAS